MVDVSTALAVLKAPAKKAFRELVRQLAGQNNALADKAFDEAIESMILDMHAAWKAEPDDERPTVEDVRRAAVDLEAEYEKARDNRKREMLNRAFLGRFDPVAYKAGMATILWDLARKLEYPEAVLLRRIWQNDTEGFAQHPTDYRPHTPIEEFAKPERTRKETLWICYHHLEARHASRLVELELLFVVRKEEHGIEFEKNHALIDAVAQFIWDG